MNKLDGRNPSKLLVAAIQKHGIEDNGSFKGDDFYLGAFQDDKVSKFSQRRQILAFTLEQLSQMYHIISGDPSRGTIALESHAAPAEGTKIQARFFDSHFRPLLTLGARCITVQNLHMLKFRGGTRSLNQIEEPWPSWLHLRICHLRQLS